MFNFGTITYRLWRFPAPPPPPMVPTDHEAPGTLLYLNRYRTNKDSGIWDLWLVALESSGGQNDDF
jgi:hypothetical protein